MMTIDEATLLARQLANMNKQWYDVLRDADHNCLVVRNGVQIEGYVALMSFAPNTDIENDG